MSQYDVAVIGGGPGGYVAAARAARRGAKTCLIERSHLGGTCLNVGCIPTKAMLRAAEVLHLARTGADFGLDVPSADVDLARVVANKDKLVAMLRGGVAKILKTAGVDVLKGSARLLDPHTIGVKDAAGAEQQVEAAQVVIATGSQSREVGAFPFDGRRILSSTDLLALTRVPARLLVVGGGVIGCEFASLFADFGAQVTVVEMLERLFPPLDPDISEAMTRSFEKRKIAVHTGTGVESLTATDAGVHAELSNGTAVDADTALVAIGRTLASEGLGLDAAGVTVERGAIPVDEHCRTNVPHIYAIGDVTGRMQLAHLASRMGDVAARNATGGEATVPFGVVPWGIFTRPLIGSVGLTEPEARDSGQPVKVARFDLRMLGIAHAYHETEGFVKLVADESTGEVLGVHIVGAHATELIHTAAVAMLSEATVDELAETIHAHPTFSEGVMEAAHTWLGEPIHG